MQSALRRRSRKRVLSVGEVIPAEEPAIAVEPSWPATIVAVTLMCFDSLGAVNVSPYLYRKPHDH